MSDVKTEQHSPMPTGKTGDKHGTPPTYTVKTPKLDQIDTYTPEQLGLQANAPADPAGSK